VLFEETKLPGTYVIRLERRGDDRGFFARAWCREEFRRYGLATTVTQANVSRSRHKGTLRGMHYQLPPAAESKVVRCTRGAIYDVALDLRPNSPTYGQWVAEELTEDSYTMLCVPEGCAHGFLTLTDDAEVYYLVSASYAPEQERGVRFDDPAFAIDWPLAPTVISDKDGSWPDYEPEPALASISMPTTNSETGPSA